MNSLRLKAVKRSYWSPLLFWLRCSGFWRERASTVSNLGKIQESESYQLEYISYSVLRELTRIEGDLELHDLILIAIARLNNCKLISKDESIIKANVVQTVW